MQQEETQWEARIPDASPSAAYFPSELVQPNTITLRLNPPTFRPFSNSASSPTSTSSAASSPEEHEPIYYASYSVAQARSFIPRRIEEIKRSVKEKEERARVLEKSKDEAWSVPDDWKITATGQVLNEDNLPIFDICEEEPPAPSTSASASRSATSDALPDMQMPKRNFLISNKSGWKPPNKRNTVNGEGIPILGLHPTGEKASPVASTSREKLKISDETHRMLDELEVEEELEELQKKEKEDKEAEEEKEEGGEEEEGRGGGEDEREELIEDSSEQDAEDKRRIEELKAAYLARRRANKSEPPVSSPEPPTGTDISVQTAPTVASPPSASASLPRTSEVTPTSSNSSPAPPNSVTSSSMQDETEKDEATRKMQALKAAYLARRNSDKTRNNAPFLPLNSTPVSSPTTSPALVSPTSPISSILPPSPPTTASTPRPQSPISAVPPYLVDSAGSPIKPALKRKGTETPPKRVSFSLPAGKVGSEGEEKKKVKKQPIILGWREEPKVEELTIEDIQKSEDGEDQPALFVSQGNFYSPERYKKKKEDGPKMKRVVLEDVVEKKPNGTTDASKVKQ
ncbi:hypothetical protein BT69DRAFT_1349282, partial [Atractiella rhizophila]